MEQAWEGNQLSKSQTSNLRWPDVDLQVLGRLPNLGTLLIVLVMAILVYREQWKEAAQLGIVGLALLIMLAAPQFLGFIAILAFLGAAMPVANRVGTFGQYRWAVLVMLALGLVLRNSMGMSGSRWHFTQFSLGLFVCFAAFSSTYSVNFMLTLLKAASFGCLLLGGLLNGRLESRPESEESCKLLDQLYWCAALVGISCALARVHLLPSGAGGFFTGPFGNANSLGAFIPLVAPVLLLGMYQSSKQPPLVRSGKFALTVIYLAVLLMTQSRGGIIATFVACAWWLYFASRKVFTWFVTVVVLVSAILVIYFPAYTGTLNRVFFQKGGHYVLQSRQRLLEDSWAAAMESPVLGVGFGATKGASEDWQFSFASEGSGREKMNSLLASIEEVGIVGTVFLVFPLAWILFASARRLKLMQGVYPASREFWTVLTLSACLLGGLTNSMVEAWLTAAGFFASVMFWLIYGVLSARLLMPMRVPQRETAVGKWKGRQWETGRPLYS
jgi:hypothetical protein